MRTPIVLAVGWLGIGISAHAQQSASFKLQESVINEGGHPDQTAVLASASFRVKLDSIGEGVVGAVLTGPSFRVEAGFTSAYPPPGEVLGLSFPSKTLLAWTPERSAGTYDVYRNGGCLVGGVTSPSTTDPAVPAPSTGFFYLVTAENRLLEEGTKGRQSNGVERPNTVACP